MRPETTAELIFEAPPRLSWPVERRLSGRAVAVWQACCQDDGLPAAADFRESELALFCADNSVELSAALDGIAASNVGLRLAGAFALADGKLTDAGPSLGLQLGQAFVELCRVRAPVSFEASLTGGDDAAFMLTRGVVLPLLDAAGLLTQALAIVTWKEQLGEVASERLCGELDAAIAASRGAKQRPSALYAAFCKPPLPDHDDAFDLTGLGRRPRAC